MGADDEVLVTSDTKPAVAIGDHFGMTGDPRRFEVTAEVASGLFRLMPEGDVACLQVSEVELMRPAGRWFRWRRHSTGRPAAANVHAVYAADAGIGDHWLYSEVKRLRAVEAELGAFREALGYSTPWPAHCVLQKLADAADHLLDVHSCDVHGHEEIAAARDAARRIVTALTDR